MADFLQKLRAHVEVEAFEPAEFVAETDRVLVVGWSRGRVKRTGWMFDTQWVMAFSIRDGKIKKFQEYAGSGHCP